MPEISLPVPGVTPGPGWAEAINSAIEAINVSSDDTADTVNTGRLSETELNATFVSQFDGTGKTVAEINAWLADGGEKRLHGEITVTAPLVVPSDTTLDLSGARLTLQAGAASCMICNTQAISRDGRDKNIRIIGGVLDRGGDVGGAVGWSRHMIVLRFADGVSVYGTSFTSSAGKYAVSFGDVTDYRAENLHFDTESDGVHVNGPAEGGTIRNLTGETHDDMVSLTANDYEAYADVAGDISDVLIENIRFNAGTHQGVKILAGKDYKVRGVTVRHIRGESVMHGVTINSDPQSPLTTGGDVSEILVDDVRVKTGAGYAAVHASIDKGGSLRARAIVLPADAAASTYALWCEGTSWDDIEVDASYTGTGAPHLIRTTGVSSIRRLVANVNLDAGSGARAVSNGGTVDWLSLSGAVKGGTHAIYNTAILPRVDLVGLAVAGTTQVFSQAGVGTTVMNIMGISLESTVLISQTGADRSVTVQGSAASLGTGVTADYNQGNANDLRWNTLAVPISLARITAPADGDIAHNSSSGLSSGVGPAVFQASAAKWKNLYSGAVYPA